MVRQRYKVRVTDIEEGYHQMIQIQTNRQTDKEKQTESRQADHQT